MKNWLTQFRLLMSGGRNVAREQDIAQAQLIRSIYGNQSRLAFDYEKPAYLRRPKTIALS